MALLLPGSKPQNESTAALATKALNKAEQALTDLMRVSDKTDDAINAVNAQIESLLSEKTALTNRRNDLEGYIKGMVLALYPDESGQTQFTQEFDAEPQEEQGDANVVR